MLKGLRRALEAKVRRPQRLKKLNFRDVRGGFWEEALSRSRCGRLARRGLWGKLLNYSRAEAARYLGLEKTGARPYFLSVEPVNYCNLSCPLCVLGGREERAELDFGLYSKLLAALGPLAVRMELYKRGEPLLHPLIVPMLELASSYKIETAIASNLNVLPPEGAQGLVRSGLDVLIVSLDGATQETYEKYRAGGKLSAVLDNLSAIAEARRRLGAQTPFILAQFVVFRHNEHELAEAAELARTAGADQLMFKPAFIPQDRRHQQDWRPLNPEFAPGAGHLRDGSCSWPWGGLNVFADGTASLCYMDEKGRWPLADVLAGGMEIWNSGFYRAARRDVSLRERGCSSAEDGSGPCRGCKSFGDANFWV